jgi:hypothetical protein
VAYWTNYFFLDLVQSIQTRWSAGSADSWDTPSLASHRGGFFDFGIV